MGMVSPKTEWGGHWESQTHLHPRPQEVWTSVLAIQVHPELALFGGSSLQGSDPSAVRYQLSHHVK